MRGRREVGLVGLERCKRCWIGLAGLCSDLVWWSGWIVGRGSVVIERVWTVSRWQMALRRLQTWSCQPRVRQWLSSRVARQRHSEIWIVPPILKSHKHGNLYNS